MTSLAGRLLVSAPDLADPNFRRSVVLMIDHSEEGAMGLVLNRTAGPSLEQLLSAIPPEDEEDPSPPPEGHSYVGGPVQPQLVTLVHAFDDLEADGKSLMPGVNVAHEIDALHEVLRRCRDLPGPADSVLRLYTGYSGWGEGQLEEELRTGSWLVVDASHELVFDCPTGFVWGRAIAQLGEPFRRYALMPFDPEAN